MVSQGKSMPSEGIRGSSATQRIVLLVILFITMFVAYMDRVNVSVLVADNAFLTEMGIKGHPVQMGMLMTAFLIAYGIANVVFSPVGDYLGPRKAMSLSMAFWCVSLIVGGLTSVFAAMVTSRVLLGMGEGMHHPMQSKFVKNWFPPQERGMANSVWLAASAAAPAVAMPFFTWTVHAWGWRPSFFILVVIGLIPIVLVWFCTADTPREHKRISPAELLAIEQGMQKEREQQSAGGKTNVLQSIQIFVSDYRFWLLVVYYIVHTSVWWGLMAWLPSYLKTARGFSWAAMGMLSSLPFVLGIVCKFVGGYFSDRAGRRAPFMVFAMFGIAVGVYFGAIVQNNMASALLLALAIAAGSVGVPAAWSLLQGILPARAVSTGAGIMNGVGNALSSLAPIVIGYLISLTGSYTSGLMYLVGMAIAGTAASCILAVNKY